MIRSGLKVPTPAMPIPDFAVPYAAPAQPKIMAAAIPPIPMKGANLGASSESAMMGNVVVVAVGADKADVEVMVMNRRNGGSSLLDQGADSLEKASKAGLETEIQCNPAALDNLWSSTVESVSFA